MEEAEERHKWDRNVLESQLLRRKELFERDLSLFEQEILEAVSHWTEIYSYRVYIGRVTELQGKFAAHTSTYQDIVFEESRLLGFKANHDVYDDLKELI